MMSAFKTVVATALLAGAIGCSASPDGANRYRSSIEVARVLGLMRTEFKPSDAAYDRADLARHFEQVVFDQERQKIDIDPSVADHEYVLTRWNGPVRYRIQGDGVGPGDAETMAALTTRLEAASGVAFTDVGNGVANYTVNIMTVEERSDWWNGLDEEGRADYENTAVEAWLRTHSVPCFVSYRTATRAGSPGVITRAQVYIKAELEDLYRTACFHEEVAQSLGLHNDHDDVRPSIFNDDGEFALLTAHDLDLLRVFYDDQLEPGMSRGEAMPIAREVIAALEING